MFAKQLNAFGVFVVDILHLSICGFSTAVAYQPRMLWILYVSKTIQYICVRVMWYPAVVDMWLPAAYVFIPLHVLCCVCGCVFTCCCAQRSRFSPSTHPRVWICTFSCAFACFHVCVFWRIYASAFPRVLRLYLHTFLRFHVFTFACLVARMRFRVCT